MPQELLDAIFRDGESKNVKPKDDEERQRTLPLLTQQLKALIARDLWDMNEYYSIMNETSEIVQKAVELLGAQ